MDQASVDLAFAIAHHLLVFSIFGVACMEMAILKPGMDPAAVRRLATIDIIYGVLAGLILIVGFARANLAAKGWDYYSHNYFFWAKIGTFLVIGLLSIQPTISYMRWKKAGATPDASAVRKARMFLHTELLLFLPILGFAAAMARGYGQT